MKKTAQTSSPPSLNLINHQAANQQSSGLWNRRLVLRLLNTEGPHSRLQIAQRTGLQNSVVTYMTRDLLEHGMIRQAGKEESGGLGRRHVLLEVNGEFGWTVGISLLQRHAAHLILMDAGNQVLDAEVVPLADNGADLAQRLGNTYSAWLKKRGRPPGKLLGLGIGLPGIVETRTGVVLKSQRFALQTYPLAAKMRELSGVPVVVDHNAHLAAHAERAIGCAKEMPDFLFFMINRSLDRDGRAYLSYGTALHLHGEVYRGAHFAAGELDRGLVPRIDLSAGEAEAVFDELAEEDGRFSPLLQQVAASLAKYLAPLADFIDPCAIVLGGENRIRHTEFLNALEEEVQRWLIPVHERRIRILASETGGQAVACGAALRALEATLYDREVGLLKRPRRTGNGAIDGRPGVGSE